MTVPRMGWLDTIVNVNWGGGYYVLFQLLVDATLGTPDVTLSLGPNSKLVYQRKDHYHTGGGTTTQYVVWLPTQTLHIHDDNPTFQPVPCHGTFQYWTGSISISLGYADVDTAYLNSATYNGLGGWFNSLTHPSSKDSAFTSAPPDIVGFGPPFSGFTAGLPFTATTAALFAAALAGMSTDYGGWADGPVPASPGANPPCWDINGDQPHAPLEFSTWSVGTRTITEPGTTFLEYVALIQVSGTPKGAEQVFTANMSGGAGWNTFVSSYKKQKHQLAPGNAGPNPYGLADGKVWYPLLPYLDWGSQIDIDGGGTQTVLILKDGTLL